MTYQEQTLLMIGGLIALALVGAEIEIDALGK